MSWVAVAIGGSTLISGVMASQAADKQASASKSALRNSQQYQMEMWEKSKGIQKPWLEASKWAMGYQAKPFGEKLKSYSEWRKDQGIKDTVLQRQLRPQTRDEFDLGIPAPRAKEDPNRYAYQTYVDDYYKRKSEAGYSDQFREGSLLDKLKKGPGEFTESPGYQFRLGEGVKALERGAAARGNLLSGAQTKALTKFGQDYGSNEYQNFINRYYQSVNPLQSLAGMGQNAAANLSGQAAGMGSSGASNIMVTGQNLSNAYANQANAMSGAVSSGAENFLLANYLRNQGRQSAYNSNYLGPKQGY